jgi:TrpR-related protein YerC/YecD
MDPFHEQTWRKNKAFKELCKAFLKCKTTTDIANFLRDVATLSEMHALTERLQVAKLLIKGMSYIEIAKKTGASTTTVTRVASFLNGGAGGYKKVLGYRKKHRNLGA